MIPVLYESNTIEYTTNGLGRLSDALSCTVEEVLNGLYELKMTYPITGIHFQDIAEDRIILAKPFDDGREQPFRIYRISRPLSGIVTINAEHISYLLNKIVVMPFTASSCPAALTAIPDNTANTCPFTFISDKTTTGPFSVDYPRPARGLLGGESGSILDVYGKGEYEFDVFRVILRVNRGSDRGVTLRYGKNLTDLVRDSDIQNVYTGIVPYWKNEETIVTLPEKVIYSAYRHEFANDIIKAVDFSDRWETAPTEAQLRSTAQTYVESNEGWKASENIKISFAALWQTEGYKNIANVERVKMGDIVHVIYEALGVEVAAEVIRTVYDVLLERYDEIELGTKRNSLGKLLSDQIAPRIEQETTSYMEQAIASATALLTGANGGHVVISTNADGEPNEIFIMDTDDTATAQHVLRINMNGIGFSSNGVDGPFGTAWTLDGAFVADYITAGVLDANIMRAGVIRDMSGENYWNLDTGEIHISAEAVVDTSQFVTQAQFETAADHIASEVVSQVGSGIFFNCVPTQNDNGTTTIRARVFFNKADVTETFAPWFFRWYKKTEDGKEYIGYGYEITVVNDEYGYGGEVEATFLILSDRYPVNQQGKWVFTMFGSLYTMVVSRGTLQFDQGTPIIMSNGDTSGNVYPVFGYDYYE